MKFLRIVISSRVASEETEQAADCIGRVRVLDRVAKCLVAVGASASEVVRIESDKRDVV